MFKTQDAMLRKLVKSLSKEGRALSEKEIEAEIAKIKSGEIEFTQEGEPIMVKKKAEKEPEVKVEAEPEYTIEYKKSDKIREGGKDIVPAFIDTKTKKITIDRELLKKKFDDKAWTKPKVEGVNALEENIFKSYREWEKFVIEHEKAHIPNPRKEGESKGEYENRINEIALAKIGKSVQPAVEPQVPLVTKIISGGQTGGDQGGLQAGKKLGIETGGTAPPGFITELTIKKGSKKKTIRIFWFKRG